MTIKIEQMTIFKAYGLDKLARVIIEKLYLLGTNWVIYLHLGLNHVIFCSQDSILVFY